MTRFTSALTLAAFLALAPTADAQTPERDASGVEKQTRAQTDPDDSVLRTPTGAAPVEVRSSRRTPSDETRATRTGPVALGTWDTSFGRVTFTRREDGRILGTMPDVEQLRFQGRLRDGVLSGTWYNLSPESAGLCDAARQGSTRWGKFEFTFAGDGSSFDGLYGACEDGLDADRAWNGVKE